MNLEGLKFIRPSLRFGNLESLLQHMLTTDSGMRSLLDMQQKRSG